MRHRFTPRTSVEKSDWHTWSPAPTPRLLPQGRGLPHCSLFLRWGDGQGEGRICRQQRVKRPERGRGDRKRSGGVVRDQAEGGGWKISRTEEDGFEVE